jgi:predicted ribosome quality control (RQC) complex YloA/Tae2 family protein
MKRETIHIQGLNREVTFLIGKSAEDNFAIIDMANDDDLWFHSSNDSSCHVIALINNLELITKDKKQLRYIVKQGALLCKKHTNKLSSSKIEFIYTKIKNICKTNIIGTVTTTSEKRIVI